MVEIDRKDQVNAASDSIRRGECPFCKADDITESRLDMDLGEAYADYFCAVCEQRWTVWYTLHLSYLTMDAEPVYGDSNMYYEEDES